MVQKADTPSSSSDHDDQKKEVVFISTPAMGMLPPTVEFARRLVHRSRGFLSATILLIQVPCWPAINSYTQSLLATSSPTLRFRLLPLLDPPAPDRYHSYVAHVSSLVDAHKPHVKSAVSELMSGRPSRVVGMFVDMFCSALADVADELGLSSYLFFASPAGFLSFVLEAPSLDPVLADESISELSLRGFANPVPKRVLPTSVLDRGDGYFRHLEHGKRYALTKGIVINTVQELEPFVLDSLSVASLPKIYHIGPILSLEAPGEGDRRMIISWLDRQPESSVVFLCFGSMGSLSGAQAREIAGGLKRAGFRFLWSCRARPKAQKGVPGEFVSFDEVLPNGFLEETRGTGIVCGWVPQVAILAHPAIGGFVSHCGWNSVLESLWHGVPIATWPIYAEQQMNAFELVRELGLAVEITTDYREGSDLVRAEEVELGMKRLMEGDKEVRAKVEDMRQKIRAASLESGSSYQSLCTLVDQLLADSVPISL